MGTFNLKLLVLLLLITISSTSYTNAIFSRPHAKCGLQDLSTCLSWHLVVETYNLRDFRVVPKSCAWYVRNYILGVQYSNDLEAVACSAIEYAKSLKLAGDGKDVWVFDIDETALSNFPYYNRTDVQFGAVAYNSTNFNEWISEGKSLVIPVVLSVYKIVQSLGIKTVFLTGTSERFRYVKTVNLKNAGYRNWEKLILRGEGEVGLSAVVYKSNRRTELLNEGYKIVGNIGDQWSDLLGPNPGNRTFKLPNPMYFIP